MIVQSERGKPVLDFKSDDIGTSMFKAGETVILCLKNFENSKIPNVTKLSCEEQYAYINTSDAFMEFSTVESIDALITKLEVLKEFINK